MEQATGIHHHQAQGLTYDLQCTLTITKEKITTAKFSSPHLKLPATTTHHLEPLIVGKKPAEAQKITIQAIREKTKGTEEHLVESLTHALHAALRDYDNQQRGEDPFQAAYNALAAYQEGYKAPDFKEHQDCSCHSDSTKKH